MIVASISDWICDSPNPGSVMGHAGAFEMTLALLQVGQVLGRGEEIVALRGFDAIEPIADAREEAFDDAGQLEAALLTCEARDLVNVERGFVRRFHLDIAAHTILCGGGGSENFDGGLAKRRVGAYDTVTF